VTRNSKEGEEQHTFRGREESHEKVRWEAESREKSVIKMGTIGEGDKDNDGEMGEISVAKLLQGSSSRRAYFVLWQPRVSPRGQ
jgi:hypothetical protein